MISNKEYSKLVKKYSHNSPIIKDCFNAFWLGGLICAIGQGFQNLYEYLGMNKDNAGTLVSITLIFLGILTTFIGWYDNIAKIGGAGTLVPITGFANSIASPAIEFKSEGLVLGLGVKMFVIACVGVWHLSICSLWSYTSNPFPIRNKTVVTIIACFKCYLY